MPPRILSGENINARQKVILRAYYGLPDDYNPPRTRGSTPSQEWWGRRRDAYNETLREAQKLRRRNERLKPRKLPIIQRALLRYALKLRGRRQDTTALNGITSRVYRLRNLPNEYLQEHLELMVELVMGNAYQLADMIIGQIRNKNISQSLLVSLGLMCNRPSDDRWYYNNRTVARGFQYTRLNRQEFHDFLVQEIINLSFANIDRSGSQCYVYSIKIHSTPIPIQGGCAGTNCKGGLNIKMFDGKLVCFSPRGNPETNDCLIHCFNKYKHNLNPEYQTIRAGGIRAELGIPKGKISIYDVPKVCKYFQLGCKIINPQKQVLLTNLIQDCDTIEMVLLHDHYVLIEKKMNHCDDCGRKYYDKHQCNRARCLFYKSRKLGEKLVEQKPKIIKEEAINYDENILYYDFETFMYRGVFQVYACGFYDAEKGCPDRFYGENSLEEFIHSIKDFEGKTLIAHNSARFDTYFVMNEFLKQGITPYEIILNNGALISFKYGKGNRFLDSCCFLSCKLDDAGKDFKIPEKYRKGSFDHNKIKSWEDTIIHQAECEKYLDNDIWCLKLVWEAFSNDLFQLFKIHTIDFMTTSSMAYAIWSNTNDQEIYIPSEDEIEVIKKSTYGANVYPVIQDFKSKQYDDIMSGKLSYKDLEDYLFILDVNSLYPTSMTKDYPVGKPRWVDGDDGSFGNKMGIWEISFTPNRRLAFSQLPRKVDAGISHSLEPGRGWYNSVDIARAIDAGYKIDEIHRGLVWDYTYKVFDDYVQMVYKEKCRAKGTPELQFKDENPVMYAITKLLLNGLYGKTLQRPIFNETAIIDSMDGAVKFVKDHASITEMSILSKNAVLYQGDVNEKQRPKSITKPTQLGSFVLGYSRTIMYDIQKAIDPQLRELSFYYTDTDCLHIHGRDMPKLQHLIGEKLGELSSDLKKEGRIIRSIYLAPKQYAVCYIDTDNKISGKQKCKGIDRKYLKMDMYENAISTCTNGFTLVGTPLYWNGDKTTAVSMKDRFKKIHHRRNGNQLEYEKFSIHLEDISRTFYNSVWKGRTWLGRLSFPLGHLYPIQRELYKVIPCVQAVEEITDRL